MDTNLFDSLSAKPGETMRLEGTEISLIGTTTNTSCGTIKPNSTVYENGLGMSQEAQTFTVRCPYTEEPTLFLFVYDDTKNIPWDIDHDQMVLHIAEIRLYGLYNGK